MNLSKIMTHAAGQSLHKGPYEAYKDYFDSTIPTDHDEEVLQTMENVCKKIDPNYKPLTTEEKEIRQARHERALDIVPRVTYDTLSGSAGFPGNLSRSAFGMAYGLKDTPEDNAKKEMIIHAYKNGTAQERHDLFLSVMNELADFDLDKYRSMSMDQKLDRLPTILPTLYKAMESEKHFRYTFVSKLQNLTLSVIENLFRANDVFVSKQDVSAQKERLEFQRAAMTDLKLLGYMALLSMEQECILPKQYEQIARQVSDCQNLLGAWMNSDRKRLQS